METKSRYEVISELEETKRKYLIERDSLQAHIDGKEKAIKQLKRQLEDSVEELGKFKSTVEDKKKTYAELIDSVDASLKRMSDVSQAPRK
ncbi:MAG TPA: hypothetical protein VMV86_00025 [Methanosarcinales archaeon]|nr:hypothetical protein [Methanosarcinales archaeon]